MSLKEKVLEYLAAVKNDPASSMAMLADDIHWINRLPAHVPFGGEYHGIAGVGAYLGQLAENFVLGTYRVDEFDYIETSNTLVMVGCEKGGKALPTGKVFDLEFVWVVRFDEQGRIKYLREHNDTAAIGAAFLA